MVVNIQQNTKVKDSIPFRDLHRFIQVLLIALLLLLSFIFGQCTFKSPHFIKFSYEYLSTKTPMTKMIVVSHFNENLSWLDLFISDKIPYIVYTRSSDPLARYNFPLNKGREAVVYLRYIVDHYSNLPSVVAFIHAHRTSWHQKDPSDAVVALRALQWNKYNYMPLTNSLTYSSFKINPKDDQTKINFLLWRDVLQKELGPPPNNGVNTTCCASFAVKREAILSHPKKFYSDIFDYIITSPSSDELTGRTLEYTWHMIFGEPAVVKYNTCDLFVCDSHGNISVSLAEKYS